MVFWRYLKNILPLFLGAGMFVFLFFPAITHAENIDSFHVVAKMRNDGTVWVSEEIAYNFGNLVRHGIFRTIQLTSEDGPRILIALTSILDEAQQPYAFTDESSARSVRWKIGDPNSTISGKKTYWLNYDVSNVIRHFDDHDEWYWNATGNEWEVPIYASDITVELPQGASVANAQAVCFAGVSGSKESECTVERTDVGFHITSLRSFQLGEGLTIAVSIPPGIVSGYAVDLPEPAQNILSFFRDFDSIFDFEIIVDFAIFVFIVFFFIFSIFRKSKVRIVIPKKLKGMPITVSYEPPEGLTPPDIGTIIDRSMDPRDMAPVLIDLAMKGYIKINYKGAKSFEFIKMRSGADLKHPAQVRIYQVLFGKEKGATPSPDKKKWWSFLVSSSVSRERVSLRALSRETSRVPGIFRSLKTEMSHYLKKQGFITKPLGVWFGQPIIYVSAFILLFIGISVESYFFVGIGFVIALITPFVRGPELLSKKGIEAFKKILGFKEYLSMVEADRLRLLNAPALKPEMFERYLPFAMIFKVEKEWAQKFEAIPLVPPQWMEGSLGTFSAVAFAGSLSSMNSSFSSAFSSASSSGGSGGGSSGGGSGGGGGGSW
ncbi:DUF2207 domain-containing protein [Candidatus Uhrbacteria bacterium]|nr:DUF2207 domain-containing protein [Candidatus Uhrbacteria bacterium]